MSAGHVTPSDPCNWSAVETAGGTDIIIAITKSNAIHTIVWYRLIHKSNVIVHHIVHRLNTAHVCTYNHNLYTHDKVMKVLVVATKCSLDYMQLRAWSRGLSTFQYHLTHMYIWCSGGSRDGLWSGPSHSLRAILSQRGWSLHISLPQLPGISSSSRTWRSKTMKVYASKGTHHCFCKRQCTSCDAAKTTFNICSCKLLN